MAAETLDLTSVLAVLRNYHRIALLIQRQGPQVHRWMLDQLAALPIEALPGYAEGLVVQWIG